MPRFLSHIAATLLCAAALVTQAHAAEDSSPHSETVLAEFVYSADRNAERDVADARVQALDEDKLLLIAFGAQWCHDSRGLSRNFSDPALLSKLRERFSIVFVDLGYYDRAGDLFRSFGMPVYFGTPTVLVIDPMTNTVLNEDSLSIWQAADSVPLDEYERYFTSEFSAPDTDDPAIAASLSSIRQWERQQAERLYAGYAKVGPMLAAEVAGESPEGIDTVWNEVRDFRVQLQRDLVRLRASARAGNDFTGAVQWPSYPAFSWES